MMRSMLLAVLGIGCPLLLAASAPAQTLSVPPLPGVAIAPAPLFPRVALQKPRLTGESVYVYSFLDLRENELGRRVLGEFEKQLSAALAASGVRPTLLSFKNSATGMLYAPNDSRRNGQKIVERLPVLETIAGNREQEALTSPRYRLLVLPVDVAVIGAGSSYTVRWIIIDVATGAIRWRHDYRGSHIIVWKNDENAVGMGNKLVQGGLEKMRGDGLL